MNESLDLFVKCRYRQKYRYTQMHMCVMRSLEIIDLKKPTGLAGVFLDCSYFIFQEVQ